MAAAVPRRTALPARAAGAPVASRRRRTAALSAGIARVEAEAALHRIEERDPARFQDLAQAALRKRSLVPAWRREVDLFFQQIDPALDSRLYPPDAPRRLVVQLYSGDIAVQPDKLWARLQARGMRIPLTLDGVKSSDGYLRALFGAEATVKARITLRPAPKGGRLRVHRRLDRRIARGAARPGAQSPSPACPP